MLSKTTDVDGLKVFCREGCAPGPRRVGIEISCVPQVL